MSSYDATLYIYEHFLQDTTGLSKMNPGLDVHQHPLHPSETGTPNVGLTDFIVKNQLFNFFMENGCIPGTKEHKLMEKIATETPAPRPIKVYGYDDSWALAGDLFEAETNCVK
jgi:hypothetical protein